MQLSIRHTTRYQYAPEAARAALRLHLHPPQTASQTLSGWHVTVNGIEVTPLLADPLGNLVSLWTSQTPLDEIEIVAEGNVETRDMTGVLDGLRQAAPPAVFLRQSRLTAPDDTVHALAAEIEGDSQLDRMHMLSELVHKAVDYRKGATSSKTTAAEAAALGAGVCQDQAHVFISAARVLGVPARYVAGYMADFGVEDAQGESSHAWAEAWVSGLGWTGFDVTNQLCPTDAYVRLAAGLDADEAAPVRGVFSGDPEERLETDVAISDMQAQSQSQA
ncbi:MAG: transglutaminase domain-containing protein [Paracoccaceae bacterium]